MLRGDLGFELDLHLGWEKAPRCAVNSIHEKKWT